MARPKQAARQAARQGALKGTGQPAGQGALQPALQPPVIADAGPLIALARLERLVLLRRLFGRVGVTGIVAGELRLGTAAPGAKELGLAVEAGWLVRLPPPTKALPQHRILDAGEASCLAAVAAAPQTLLLIDERLGRSEARRIGLTIMGTAGVLCAAKELGYLKAVMPVVHDLLAAGYFMSDAVVNGARQLAGE